MTEAARRQGSPQGAGRFQSVALLLQGGGALAAYQAGVYEALSENGIVPDWVGGISMGAVNGAIIAGNKPADRLPMLSNFWKAITSSPPFNQWSMLRPLIKQGGRDLRIFWNQMSTSAAMAGGVPGFFKPHILPPWFFPAGAPDATSFYDTDILKKTLNEFIDFDILNSGDIRFTTSAVNVRNGNSSIFDTQTQRILPEHIMASGALPPGLPAIEIEGQYYWDGGLISNTPLQWVMREEQSNTLAFQVDLWSARGEFPNDIAEVMTRQKEIQYSSRTRAITERFRQTHKMRHSFAKLYKQLPEDLKKTKEAQLLNAYADIHVYNIVHLIYRAKGYEGYSKDCEFSELSMHEHWNAGYKDTIHSLRHKEIFELPDDSMGIATFDLTET